MVTHILFSFVLPVLIGVGLVAIGWMIPVIRRRHWLEGSAFGIALGATLFASFFAEVGMPTFPPPRSDAWVGLIALCIAPIAVLFALTGRREFPWLEVPSCLLGVLIALLPVISELSGGKAKPLFPGMTAASHGLLALAIAFGGVALSRLQQVRPGATIPTVVAMSCGAGALCALASGWITMTFLFGVLAAVCGVSAILARTGGKHPIGRGGAIAAVMILTVLPMATWHKTTAPEELAWWFWLLIAGAPLLLLPLENRVIAKVSDLSAYWIRIVVVAIPIAYVIYLLIPMLAGGESSGGDEMDEMMRMYQ